MIYLVIILSVLVAVLGYATFNLLRKNEKQEDILAGYMRYLNKISDIIQTSNRKLEEIDAKGSFKSDDEIGFFFQSILAIQDVLNSFDIRKL